MSPIPEQISSIRRPVDALMTYYVLKSLAALLGAPILLPLLFFRFHTMRYEFSDEGIRMSWGILFRNEVVLQYAKIQDIQLRSNAVERWLGLARIEVQTASGSSGSEMTLEGMADAEGMRDFLYSRMRGSAGGKESATPEASLALALREVAVELRAVRVALEQRR
jgi:putative membrane protein